MLNVNGKISAIVAALVAVYVPTSVSAEEVTLTFSDHDVVLVGEYMGFEDKHFIIDTENGEMHVPATMVSCSGQDCIAALAANTVSG